MVYPHALVGLCSKSSLICEFSWEADGVQQAVPSVPLKSFYVYIRANLIMILEVKCQMPINLNY